MKFLYASLFVVFAVAITAIHAGKKEDWAAFKKSQNKDYSANKDVEGLRAEIFWKKDKEIKAHNSNPSRTFDRAHNKFSDMTEEEKETFHGVSAPPPSSRQIEYLERTVEDRQLPPSLDYRNNSCLPAVKNQGSCGSCWAFGAIAPLEFSRCMKTKTPVVLSEKQLVDCDNGKYQYGCNGGFYTRAWNYLKAANGSAKQSLYPYTATQGTCKFNTTMIGAKVLSYTAVSVRNAAAMQSALVANGPLSVAIGVAAPFYSYKSGVYADDTCKTLLTGINHAVNIVGYGTLNNIPYWIVRNSWGATWGMKGYILMKRGVNLCWIEDYPYYVTASA